MNNLKIKVDFLIVTVAKSANETALYHIRMVTGFWGICRKIKRVVKMGNYLYQRRLPQTQMKDLETTLPDDNGFTEERSFAALVAGSVLVVVVLVLALAWLPALIAGDRTISPAVTESSIPKTVILVESSVKPSDFTIQRLRRELVEEVPEIGAVTVLEGDSRAIALVAFSDRGGYLPIDHPRVQERLLEQARSVMVAQFKDLAPDLKLRLVAGGRASTEAVTAASYNWLIVLVCLLAAVATIPTYRRFGKGGFISALIGWPLSVMSAALITAQMGVEIAHPRSSNPLPGAIAALVMAVVVGLRLCVWYENVTESDPTSKIRRAVFECGFQPLIILVLLALADMVLFLGAVASGITAVLSGATVGLAITMVITPICLSVPDALGEDQLGTGSITDRWKGDGRNLPVLIILIVVLGLVLLSVIGPPQPADSYASEPGLGHEQSDVDAWLSVNGGDPSQAIAVSLPHGLSLEQRLDWAAELAALSEVGSVVVGGENTMGGIDTFVQGTSAAEIVKPSESLLLAVASQSGLPVDEVASRVAMVLPAYSGVTRSALATLIGSIPTGQGEAQLYDSWLRRPGHRWSIITVMLTWALSCAVVVWLLGYGRGATIVVGFLQLLALAATAGVVNLVAPDSSIHELSAIVVVMGMLLMLFDLDLLSELTINREFRWVEQYYSQPALLCVIGLLGIGIVGLFANIVGPTPGAMPLLFGLGASLLVVALSYTLILSPVLVGQRRQYHRFVRPFRAYAARFRRQSSEEIKLDQRDLDLQWYEVVGQLLATRFGLEQDPDNTELESVYQSGSYPHKLAAQRRAVLLSSGLEVRGELPQLLWVKQVNYGVTPKLAIGVKNPKQRLVTVEETVLGVRSAEIFVEQIWLQQGPEQAYQILDSVKVSSL